MSALMEKYSSVYKLIPNHSESNLTTAFKNSGRTQMHAFGARYNRPMHDLDYTKPILQFSPNKNADKSRSKSKSSLKNPENTSQFRIKSLIKSSSASRNINSTPGVKLHNYNFKGNSQIVPLQSREQQFIKNLGQKQFQRANKSGPFFKTMSKLKESTFGLSDCQIQNTIIGKVHRRSSHHINFQKMPDRQVNINKIWYDKNEVFSPLDRQRNKSIKHKIHIFKSDSPHKAFQAKESLDKFYDASDGLVKRRSDAVIRSLDKVKSRPQLQVKLGTNLDYEKNRSLENKKRPIFNICQTERKLEFTRQIISPKKGVYR